MEGGNYHPHLQLRRGRVKDTCYYPKHGKDINRIKKSRDIIAYIKKYCFQYNLLLRLFGDIDMNEFNTERLKEY